MGVRDVVCLPAFFVALSKINNDAIVAAFGKLYDYCFSSRFPKTGSTQFDIRGSQREAFGQEC